MSEQDLYEVLGVSPTATPEQISHAYRALVRRHHPDSRPAPRPDDASHDHDQALREIMTAYATLGDATRRTAYDRERRARDAVVGPPPAGRAPGPTGTEIWVGPVLYETDTPPAHRTGHRAAPAGFADLVRVLLWGWR